MQQAKPRVTLLRSLLLRDFPSGSSISYYNGKFYLVGDDAGNVAVLDRHYGQEDVIRLFDHPEKRIPKAQKTDFETAVIVQVQHKPHLLAIGSASRREREKVMLISLQEGEKPVTFDTGVFTERLKKSGIKEVNIEGATVAGNHLILANRGNNTYPENHLIITEKDYWTRQDEATLSVVPFTLSEDIPGFLGVSELCYDELSDTLLFTLSSEATANAYDDGAIGDSYIGWTGGISKQLRQTSLTPDALINLPQADAGFRGEKIEGICIEEARSNELLLHLVADNDKGESRLFQIKLKTGDL
jgi:hypothetical protein